MTYNRSEDVAAGGAVDGADVIFTETAITRRTTTNQAGAAVPDMIGAVPAPTRNNQRFTP